MPKIIHWQHLCHSGQALHASFASQSKGGSWQMHGHDFYEIFFVESGIGLHYLKDKKDPERLISGQIWFVREKDWHGFSAATSNEPFACINIAFPTSAWNQLRDRYALSGHHFLNDRAPSPPVFEPPPELGREVATLFHRTLRRPPTSLTRDAFILGLATLTGSIEVKPPSSEVPAWLRRGMVAMEHDHTSWKSGASALAESCGCSLTHLARLFRCHYNQSPTEWLLGLKLARAKRLLSATGFAITDVAYECGFENLSHFHRSFKKHLKVTPLQYRKSARREAF